MRPSLDPWYPGHPESLGLGPQATHDISPFQPVSDLPRSLSPIFLTETFNAVTVQLQCNLDQHRSCIGRWCRILVTREKSERTSGVKATES